MWSYGQRNTTLGPALTLFTAANHVNNGDLPGLDGWADTATQCCGRLPSMYVNTGPALAYADAMTLATSVPDDVFADVRRRFDDREIVELSVLIGTYIMHNRVMNALGIDLEPESNRGR